MVGSKVQKPPWARRQRRKGQSRPGGAAEAEGAAGRGQQPAVTRPESVHPCALGSFRNEV